MKRMPGGQEIVFNPILPEWAMMLREFRYTDEDVRRERMEGYLADRNLQGVALISSRPEG